ncbi:MAG: exosortase A [Acetobacteraceae bacterium]
MTEAGSFRRLWPGLAVALLVLGLVFHAEIAAAIHIWLGSTAYNHCFLILPMAAYLAWERRRRLGWVPLRPTLLALPAGLVLGAIWFLADRLGIMEGRQLAAIGFVQLLFLSVFGVALYRAMAAPLLYLFFLVPFGGFLVPMLQSFTTHFVVHGLNLIGIPNYYIGNDIEIPEGVFRIAEACAGLRFLIAAIAFSVFYACIIYRNPGRRVLFIAIAMLVPVIANGLRALGIVWLGHVLGSARAAATDHVVYGYLFFSIVLFLLILLGLVFRQDRIPPEVPEKPVPWRPARVLLPAALTIVLAALFPLVAGRIDRAAAATRVALPEAIPGCVPAPNDIVPQNLAAGGGVLRRFACGRGTILLSLAAFPPRSDPRLIVDAERMLSGRDTREAETGTLHITGPVPANWQLVFIQEPPAATASAIWIGGKPAANDLHTRMRQALASLFGSEDPPLVITLEVAGPPGPAQARLASFLSAGSAIPEKLASLLR